MTPYFASAERRQRLLSAARSWQGTPFRVHNRARGPRGGVDCGNLIQELLLESGFMAERLPLPRPPLDYGQHHVASIVCRFLEETPELAGRFAKLIEADPQAGDLAGVVIGQCVHHLMMVLPGSEAIQALKPHGVTIFPVDEIRERIAIIYRPIECGGRSSEVVSDANA